MLKLLWREPESEATRNVVATENAVIVSSLVALEVEVQPSWRRSVVFPPALLDL